MNPLHSDRQREIRRANGRPDLSLSVLFLGPHQEQGPVHAEERAERLLCCHLAGKLTPALAVVDRLDLDSARRRQRNPEAS